MNHDRDSAQHNGVHKHESCQKCQKDSMRHADGRTRAGRDETEWNGTDAAPLKQTLHLPAE